MGFRKGRQYATTWVEKAGNTRGTWNGYLTIGGKEYRAIDCYLEALKRDPEYAEAWCKLGLEIRRMGASEDTDKTLVGMDLFKDEPKITDDKTLHYAQINAAIFCFDKAIEIEPKYVDAWYQKGSWYNYWVPPWLKEQIECFLEVTKLDPKHKEAWYHLANAYSGTDEYAKAIKCYDEAIALSPDNLHVVYAKKADLFSECVKQREYFYRGIASDLKKKYSSGKDALMCYDKALEIKPEYVYASYKKGMLLERLSRYEEALECFEGFGGKYAYDRDTAKSIGTSNVLHRQALRDKLKPNSDGSTESFETYCRVLGIFFENDELSEVEYARKKLNENILQHIYRRPDTDPEDDFWDMGSWLQNIGREKEALELYDKHIEKSLEKGDLDKALAANTEKARYFENINRDKDAFDCYEKTIQLCEKSTEDLDDSTAYWLAEAYVNNARTFKTSDNMDKAIEYIDHAIKLEREYSFDDYYDHWSLKVDWLPDEEAIKFLDEEIKTISSSSLDKEEKERYIESMEYRRNKLLKPDLKSNT